MKILDVLFTPLQYAQFLIEFFKNVEQAITEDTKKSKLNKIVNDLFTSTQKSNLEMEKIFEQQEHEEFEDDHLAYNYNVTDFLSQTSIDIENDKIQIKIKDDSNGQESAWSSAQLSQGLTNDFDFRIELEEVKADCVLVNSIKSQNSNQILYVKVLCDQKIEKYFALKFDTQLMRDSIFERWFKL